MILLGKPRMNRQVRKTRTALKKGLLELLKEKNFSRITISEIAEKADIARPTFYSHFESKEELLLSHFEELLDELFIHFDKYTGEYNDKKEFPPSETLFNEIKLNPEISMFFDHPELAQIIQKRFEDFHRTINNQIVSKRFPGLPPVIAEYYIVFMSNTAVSLVQTWIKNGMAQSTEDMGKLLHMLAGPEQLKKVIEVFEGQS